MATTTLRETAVLAPATASSGRILVRIIDAGWGSSGYYSAEALEQAAKDRVWPAGTHMYVDHPAASEAFERPERTVRDLAAVLTEDPRYDVTEKALVAEARVFSQWRDPLADMKDAIGVSIRASAEGDLGEAEGRTGFLISRLVEGESVDFVTRAGRGGKVLEVLESKRAAQEARNVGQWVESRIHRDFTITADEMFGDGRLTREERITLSGAIGDALAAFVARLEADAPALYARDLWEEPGPATTSASEAATSVPSRPAGQSTPTASLEDHMGTTQIEESRLAQLETDAGRATVLESERAAAVTRAETAEAALVEAHRNEDTARAVAIVAEADTEFDALQTAGLIAQRPLTESGRLDADAFTTLVATEAAKLAEAQGAGSVRGVGHTAHAPTGADLSEAELDRELAALSGRTVKEA